MSQGNYFWFKKQLSSARSEGLVLLLLCVGWTDFESQRHLFLWHFVHGLIGLYPVSMLSFSVLLSFFKLFHLSECKTNTYLGDRHSTFALHTQPTRVRFSAFPRYFRNFLMLLRFNNSALLRKWTVQSLIVVRTHTVLLSGKLVQQKIRTTACITKKGSGTEPKTTGSWRDLTNH